MGTFVFLHAHPDDEAIFSGGTIALLAGAGQRVVVVYATNGELGIGAGPGLADTRRAEARRACVVLGASRVEFLGHHDSGIDADPRCRPQAAFVNVGAPHAARELADLLAEEHAVALVTYDRHGIYGHPDHVHCYDVGVAAARLTSTPTWYELTLDREYLHFVETHVATAAGRSLPTTPFVGLPTVEITTMVDVASTLDRKHAAIAEHRSQIDDPTFGTGLHFDAVYGFEWYVRHGPATLIDTLGAGDRRWVDAPR